MFGNSLLPRRFWDKIQIDTNTECWTWVAALTFDGYARFAWEGGQVRGHRLAYATLVGPIPDELVTDHLCRNRACCNPAHLELVTRQVKTLRGEGPSARSAQSVSCINGHPYDARTRRAANGSRVYRRCDAAKTQRYRARQLQAA